MTVKICNTEEKSITIYCREEEYLLIKNLFIIQYYNPDDKLIEEIKKALKEV